MITSENDWCTVIRNLTLRLCVNSNEIKVLPNLFDEFIKVPFEVSRYGDVVRDSVKDIKLRDGDLIDLVEHINARDIEAVAFNDIDEIISGGIATKGDICVGDLVLVADGLDGVLVHVGLWHGAGHGDTTLLLLLERDVGRLFVQTDTETFKLLFDESLVSDRLQSIKHDEDEVACASDSDNGTTTTLTILSTLNDTGQIDKLNPSTLVVDDTRHGSKSSELVCSNLRECISELSKQCTLSYARETNETYT